MVKGVSIKFKSYGESVSKILEVLKVEKEIKKYDKIILKPYLAPEQELSTSAEFVEEVLKFCLANKNPVAEIFIAEGADGENTNYLFESRGYKTLAEKYSIGLIDLNEAETETIEDESFLKFEGIHYPSVLKKGFVISLPKLAEEAEVEMVGALSNMLGAFPWEHYGGILSRKKKKLRKWPIKFAINDIVKCKLPEFTVVDASEKGVLLAGLPFEIDKQSARLLGKKWEDISYLRLISKELEKGDAVQDSKLY